MRIAFWNAGLGARVKDRDARIDQACETVQELFDAGAKLVGLCEVDREVITRISAKLSVGPHASIIADGKVGKHGARWDLAVLYLTDKITCHIGLPLFVEDAGNVVRAGHSFEVDVTVGWFTLFLAHWPSRREDNKGNKRMLAARRLWAGIKIKLDEDTPVLVLGDFNDEPFDQAVQTVLKASRDPMYVNKYATTRLYNPSWWLCCPEQTAPWGRYGSTSRYKTDDCYFHQLDQALVSAHFLDKSKKTAPVCVRLPVTSSVPLNRTMSHMPLGVDL